MLLNCVVRNIKTLLHIHARVSSRSIIIRAIDIRYISSVDKGAHTRGLLRPVRRTNRVIFFSDYLSIALVRSRNKITVGVDVLGLLAPRYFYVHSLGVFVLLLYFTDQIFDIALRALEYGRILLDLTLDLHILDAHILLTEARVVAVLVTVVVRIGRALFLERGPSSGARRLTAAAALNEVGIRDLGRHRVLHMRKHRERLAVLGVVRATLAGRLFVVHVALLLLGLLAVDELDLSVRGQRIYRRVGCDCKRQGVVLVVVAVGGKGRFAAERLARRNDFARGLGRRVNRYLLAVDGGERFRVMLLLRVVSLAAI